MNDLEEKRMKEASCKTCHYYVDGKCGTDGEDVKPDHICYGYTNKEDEEE